uniref:Uncharacterized protein n=1 Tax=Anguilla anguilla TaxID=7936 RepID=A0A0E9W5E0_ANGAN
MQTHTTKLIRWNICFKIEKYFF